MAPVCPFCSDLRDLTGDPKAKCANCLSRETQRNWEQSVNQRLDYIDVFIEEIKSVLREEGLPDSEGMVREFIKRIVRLAAQNKI